jgi:hypothetical protein
MTKKRRASEWQRLGVLGGPEAAPTGADGQAARAGHLRREHLVRGGHLVLGHGQVVAG